MSALGRLTDAGEFKKIVVKTGSEKEIVRLGDIAQVELGR